MEQLPLSFVQATVEPDIQECFTPAFNFTKINSSNGRLAFTKGRVYWLPDNPMAFMDQGWVIKISEIANCSKHGISGFSILLNDGKELRFANVSTKMREGILEAIEAHKNDVVEDAPAAEGPSPETQQTAPEAAPAIECDPEDVKNNKLMAALAYLGVLVFIPLFAAKESKFARFHTNQGLILLILSVVIYFIGRIGSLSTIAWLLNAAVAILAIIGIINAVKGQTKALPLVGKYRIISE